jgi:hypothetical protein
MAGYPEKQCSRESNVVDYIASRDIQPSAITHQMELVDEDLCVLLNDVVDHARVIAGWIQQFSLGES